MSTLTVQQRRALRYAATKAAGDREVQAAEQLQHASSSTPSLQRFFESPRGQVLMLLTGLAIFAMFAPLGTF
jgi:hypothetical protein